MAFDLLIAKTATSVCTICSAAIAINTEYVRQAYDGRHTACHEALAAAIDKAAAEAISKARAETKKAKTQVAIPTDAEQRELYRVAKKAGTLDILVKGRKAKAQADGSEAPAPKAEANAQGSSKGKAEAKSNPAADWDKRKGQIDRGLELGRLSPEQHAAALAELGARPETAAAAS